MRTARVFFLFMSLLQFIFFLKLVEYVRGEEIPTGTNVHVPRNGRASNLEEKARGLFIAPKLNNQKKLATWSNGKNGSLAQTKNVGVPFADERTNNGSHSTVFKSKREQYEHEVARLCPGCEGSGCNSIKPISGGFPIVPVIIAVFVGVGWFILFLIAWIFHTRPNTKGQQSGGYGYGSPENEYGDDDEKPSIFDHFLKPHERSLQSYTQLLNNVLDSVGKLSDLYNSY